MHGATEGSKNCATLPDPKFMDGLSIMLCHSFVEKFLEHLQSDPNFLSYMLRQTARTRGRMKKHTQSNPLLFTYTSELSDNPHTQPVYGEDMGCPGMSGQSATSDSAHPKPYFFFFLYSLFSFSSPSSPIIFM